jgi:uncharacterized membrane protein
VQLGGLLPEPQILAEFDKVVPGMAARLLAAFEKQAEHRREMEAKAQAAQIADTRRGQVFGLIIGLAALVGGSLTAVYASGTAGEIAGGFIGGGGVIGLVSVFVLGRYVVPVERKTRRLSRQVRRLPAVLSREGRWFCSRRAASNEAGVTSHGTKLCLGKWW